jgi:hypothetical protein
MRIKPMATQAADGNAAWNVLTQRLASSTFLSSRTNRQFPQWKFGFIGERMIK